MTIFEIGLLIILAFLVLGLTMAYYIANKCLNEEDDVYGDSGYVDEKEK